MEKNPACYIYAPGQYVGRVRQISGASLGVTIPKGIARNLHLRPGMEIMVVVSPAEADLKEKGDGAE